MLRAQLTLVLLLLAGGPCVRSAAAEDVPAWGDVQKLQRKAFKRLSLPKHDKLAKELEPRLPGGVVIEAAPFDKLVAALLTTHREQLAAREAALRALAQHPSSKAGKALEPAFQTLAKEEEDLAKRLADVEEAYDEVYNRGYMESSEGARRTRKLAAVLIPFYRTLQARTRALGEQAVDVLAAMKEGEALEWLLSAARANREPDLRVAAARALGRVGGPQSLAQLQDVARGDADARVRQAALIALCAWPVKDMKAAILGALGDAAWEMRALAVTMCARARLAEAAEALIATLAKEDGRLRTDIDDALFALLGVRMYADVALWQRWLQENQAKVAAQVESLTQEGAYEAPLGPPADWSRPAAPTEEGEDEKRAGTAAFYGIVSRSKRIVFVIDISRSMQDEAADKPPPLGDPHHPYAHPQGSSKMDIARWQLHRVVHDLPEDAQFTIVVYSESYKVWEAQLTRAKDKAKKAAHAFIDQLVANGTTNIGDSLEKVLALAAPAEGGLAADSVYLLSDGDPNRGRLNVLSELLEDFVQRNLRARLVVHTIGIGEAAGSSFLKDLAAATGGQYVGLR